MDEHAVLAAPSRRGGPSRRSWKEPSCRRHGRRARRNSHAEREVVDRDPLVGRVDQPRRELRAHRAHREEPVGDGAERLAQPVGVGEAGDADRREPGAGLDLVDERLDRRPERCAELRAGAALAVRATRARSRPRRATRARARPPPPPSGRAAAGSRRSPRSAPESRSASRRPRSSSARPSARAAARPSRPRPGRCERARASALARRRHRSRPRPRESPRLSGISPGTGSNSPSRSIEPGRLDERVVGDRRHRPMAATARGRAARTGELRFSAAEQRYSTRPPSSMRSPAPSLTA